MKERHFQHRPLCQVYLALQFIALSFNIVECLYFLLDEIIQFFSWLIDVYVRAFCPHAEHVMMIYYSIQGDTKCLGVKSYSTFESYALVIMFSMRQVQVEEIAHDGTWQDFAFYRLL